MLYYCIENILKDRTSQNGRNKKIINEIIDNKTTEEEIIRVVISNKINKDIIKKINAKMIVLDLKEDVIKKCNDIAKRYDYKNLHFELGDICRFKYNNAVDMGITLHACDMTTDYALYNDIKFSF